MAWTSIKDRLPNLPLVLAGPQVRKTTKNSVSVWIALKSANTNLTLNIFEQQAPGLAIVGSGTAATRRLGKNLHVAVITATIPAATTLQTDTIYFYDVNFGSGNTFASAGILDTGNGISRIVYGSDPLPSFILPSADITKLKIIHASCRKPHGGNGDADSKDALISLDILLGQTYNNPATRPQQAYFTGDQIYADDVHDLLLALLRDAQNGLMGWKENEELPILPGFRGMEPMHRYPLIEFLLTAGEVGHSHLFLLAEFYMMYLFVWSDVLWPPTPNDYPRAAFDLYADGIIKLQDRTEEFVKRRNVLERFRSTLPGIRKALANISLYMIFDDHEVTDDWFLTYEWTRTPLDLGPSTGAGQNNATRLIQNGVCAYAVFQGWGNTPERFSAAGSPENVLLDLLEDLNRKGEARKLDYEDFKPLRVHVLPTLTAYSNQVSGELTGSIEWSYSLSFDLFNVIVLNPRTRRSLFPTYPAPLSTAAIQNQITDRLGEKTAGHYFTLLIAPAPVIGVPAFEEFAQPLAEKINGPAFADKEAWSLDRNKFEHLLNALSPFRRVLILSGDVHYGYTVTVDYWNSRSGTEQRSKYVNLVSSALKNSDSKTAALETAVNNGIEDLVLGTTAVEAAWVGWNIPGNYIKSETKVITAVGTSNTSTGSKKVDGAGEGIPHIHRLVTKESVSMAAMGSGSTTYFREWVLLPPAPGARLPDWQYRIHFVTDPRLASVRKAAGLPVKESNDGWSARLFKKLKPVRGRHTAVGKNNMGEVTFHWGANENDRQVIHKLWSNDEGVFKPLTVHIASFGIPSATQQRPHEIGRVE
jgi:hypothetical protein